MQLQKERELSSEWNGKCFHQCMVCKGEVTTNTNYKKYKRASEEEFKRNLSDTYVILMIQNYSNTFGRLKQVELITT